MPNRFNNTRRALFPRLLKNSSSSASRPAPALLRAIAARLVVFPRAFTIASLAFGLLATAQAGPAFPEFVDPNPSPGNGFGAHIVPLSTGNVVITSPAADIGAPDTGAVYLFNGATGALISTLTGSEGDFVGISGVTALTNGNYVVGSRLWTNGAATGAGAVTWGNGATGINGVVSAANSLVGSTASDNLGGQSIVALTNGNYVVVSRDWDNGAVSDAGAVTWGNGATAGPRLVGPVSAANSLVGTTGFDQVGGNGVTVLTNGNYVVRSADWDNGDLFNAGAVTWGSGTTGITGPVSVANSLVGSKSGDGVGSGVTALTNGNYVVTSTNWDNGSIDRAGAVTWGNGTTGISGPVSAANSLVGSTAGDNVGNGSTIALTNGNYVVASSNWNNGGTLFAGAVTWGDGTTGISGPVSAANSLVGSTAGDNVGRRLTPLTNGNYVVASSNWRNGSIANAGAVTWCDGATATTGPVTAANSLVGTAASDNVGGAGVAALANGNYVVASSNWDDGSIENVGAVTWGNGNTTGPRLAGPVSAVNSLVGSKSGDNVGNAGATALTNGNYVVRSTSWDDGAVLDVGAVTWGNGATGIVGTVSVANSLVGSTASDGISNLGVIPLTNGNYVVRSSNWDNGSIANAGAVTWGNGATGIVGIVSAANSLVGSTAGDNVGNSGVTALTNGNYVVRSGNWDNGTLLNAGAATFGNGATGVSGVINSSNSAVGLVANAAPNVIGLDDVNNHFIIRFINEGKVRLGSQVDGFSTNAAPTDIALNESSIAENNAPGATIGALTATDADAGQTHTFALVSGAGSTDNAAFTITGNTLTINAAADFETKASYAIRIRATDSGAGSLTFEKQFTITVTDVAENAAPTDITLSATSIAENNAPNATIGTLSAVDADSGDTHTFAFDNSTEMSVDNGAFTITGNALKLNASADFETKSVYYIQVQANDGNGGTYSAPFTITITDVNEVTGPVVGITTGQAVPGAPVGTTFANMTGLPGADAGYIGATNIKLPNGKIVRALANSSGIIIKVGDLLAGAGNAEIAKLDSMSFGVFQAELKLGTGSPAVTTSNHRVVCLENGSGVQVLARSGQAAPGGSTFKFFSASTGDAAGNVFIAANLNDPTNVDGGLWAIPAGGAMTLLVKEGQNINLGNGSKRVNAVASFPAGVKSQAEGRVHYGTDSVITRITLGADHAIVVIPANATGSGDWTVVAMTNGNAPGAIGKYTTLGLPAAEGTNVVFTATLNTAGAVTTANNGIVVANGAVIAREGDAAPGTSGTFVAFEDVAAGTTGQASFTANISGATTATDSGLWEYRASALSLVARQGDAAPDLSGVTIVGISRFAHPGGGLGPVFTATLGGATAKTNVGLFGVPATGGSAINLARTGDLFDIGGTMRALTTISALKMDLGNEGVARGYNDTSVFMIGSFGVTRSALLTLPVALPEMP